MSRYVPASEATGEPTEKDWQRFWVKVDKQDDGCWLWTSELSRNGYGRFMFKRNVGAAHRWIYKQMVGPIPEGLVIDHLCRVRNCVNPDHLEPVTVAENNRRGLGTAGYGLAVTECRNGHDITDAANLISGTKQCKVCNYERNNRRRRALTVRKTLLEVAEEIPSHLFSDDEVARIAAWLRDTAALRQDQP